MGKLRGVLRTCLRGAMRMSPLFKVEACPAWEALPVTFLPICRSFLRTNDIIPCGVYVPQRYGD